MLLTQLLCLQVAAYTNGRQVVSEFDCLLLQHVLWQRPGESQRIADYLLSQTASDSGAQIELLLAGALFNEYSSISTPLQRMSSPDHTAELRIVMHKRPVRH